MLLLLLACPPTNPDKTTTVDACVTETYYLDADGDGYGNSLVSEDSCLPLDGMVTNALDCSDEDAAIFPGATDECGDSLDTNCDGNDACPQSLGKAWARVIGLHSYSYLGWAAAGTSDFDGDGAEDLLVTAAFGDTTADEEVEAVAYVMKGPLSGDHTPLEAVATLVDEPWGSWSWTYALPGDLDGDGLDDLLVGAPSGTDHEYRPYVSLFHGPLTGALAPTDAVWQLKDVSIYTGLGSSLVPMGDTDGDGQSELVISIPYTRGDGDNSYPTLSLFEGPWTGPHIPFETTIQWEGHAASAGFPGCPSVSGADMNGDGLRDLVVGDAFAWVGDQEKMGAVYLHLAPFSGVSSLEEADAVRTGTQPQSGYRVTAGGDFDGDGYADLAALSPGDQIYGSIENSRLWIVRGPVSGTASLAEADASFEGDGFWGLDFVGDVNGDGRAELGLGARGDDSAAVDAGRIWLLSGPLLGSLSLEGTGQSWLGERPGDQAGSAISAAGDLTGDGDPDVIVTAANHDEGLLLGVGAVYVLEGN